MIHQKAILLKSGAEFIGYPELAGTYVVVHYVSQEGEVLIEVPFRNEQRTYTPFVRQEDVFLLNN